MHHWTAIIACKIGQFYSFKMLAGRKTWQQRARAGLVGFIRHNTAFQACKHKWNKNLAASAGCMRNSKWVTLLTSWFSIFKWYINIKWFIMHFNTLYCSYKQIYSIRSFYVLIIFVNNYVWYYEVSITSV